jgi:tRNA (cmo5U34)-methyltransferase
VLRPIPDVNKDKLYTKHIHTTGFCFDEQVASVFDDMIHRSVPGYQLSLNAIEVISSVFAKENTNIYDLGCSLGAASVALLKGSEPQGCPVIAVDNSEPMIAHCRAHLQSDRIHLQCQDILSTPIENASVIVLNFVLQFIDPSRRMELIQNIYNGLNPGGILILSEKISFDQNTENETMIQLHEAFKKSQGYSELEISRKRKALEDVLRPESLPQHYQRLEKAGFSQISIWFRCFNFASLVACK